MLMTVSKTLIRTQLMMGCDPAQALERVNVQLADQHQSMLSLKYYGAQDKG